MNLVLILAVFCSSSVQAAARASTIRINQLRPSSSAYFSDPDRINNVSLFKVRETVRAKSTEGRPIFISSPVCQIAAYVHLFSFGQTPAMQLTREQTYVLLHVRRDWEDEEADHAHIRIALGSIHANPRVLMLDCRLRPSDSLAELDAALASVFAIKP